LKIIPEHEAISTSYKRIISTGICVNIFTERIINVWNSLDEQTVTDLRDIASKEIWNV